MNDLFVLIIKAKIIIVEIDAAFTGLGGGFLIISILLFLFHTVLKPVGVSFITLCVTSIRHLSKFVAWLVIYTIRLEVEL
jgi:uncharacterized membrane protein YfcA